MFAKVLIILFFLMILYNLFAGLRQLLSSERDSKKLLISLKWRIGLSVTLFILIILAFFTGTVQLHTFG